MRARALPARASASGSLACPADAAVRVSGPAREGTSARARGRGGDAARRPFRGASRARRKRVTSSLFPSALCPSQRAPALSLSPDCCIVGSSVFPGLSRAPRTRGQGGSEALGRARERERDARRGRSHTRLRKRLWVVAVAVSCARAGRWLSYVSVGSSGERCRCRCCCVIAGSRAQGRARGFSASRNAAASPLSAPLVQRCARSSPPARARTPPPHSNHDQSPIERQQAILTHETVAAVVTHIHTHRARAHREQALRHPNVVLWLLSRAQARAGR